MTGCVDRKEWVGALKFEKGMEKWNKRLAAAGAPPHQRMCQPKHVKLPDTLYGLDDTVGRSDRYYIHNYRLRDLLFTDLKYLHIYMGNIDDIKRERNFYTVAKKMLPPGIVEHHHRVVARDSSPDCNLRLVATGNRKPHRLLPTLVRFLDTRGDGRESPRWCRAVAAMAVRAIEMLHEVHNLGLVHGHITGSSFVMDDDWGIKYLYDFTHVAPWVNSKTGEPWGVTDESTRLIGLPTDISKYGFRKTDMVQLADVLLGLVPAASGCTDVNVKLAAFRAAMDRLGDAVEPAYEDWIAQFDALDYRT